MAEGDVGEAPPGGQRPAASPLLAGLVSLLVALVNQRYGEPLQALRAERRRLVRVAVFAACTILFSVIGVVSLSFGVIVFFWDRDRLVAIGGVIGFYWLLALVCFWRLRALIKQGSCLLAQR